MTDEEFEKLYGRPPLRAGTQKKVKVYWGRIIVALIVFVLIVCGIVQLVRSIANHFKKDDEVKPAVVNSVAESSEEFMEKYFAGEEDLSETIYKIKLGSRHYAKRQLTWFNRDPHAHRFSIDRLSFDEIADQAQQIINDFLKDCLYE